jgi:hypothetical protein
MNPNPDKDEHALALTDGGASSITTLGATRELNGSGSGGLADREEVRQSWRLAFDGGAIGIRRSGSS